uniref:FAM69 protein-kinase domain-containing protein n=1 Tax=Photinus pyralis TaxID=7054 RepID=A0A1Y1NHE8_PHOPY
MKYFIIPIILSLFLYNFFKVNLPTICETDFDYISLQSNSFVELFSNYFSVKYVFYGSFNNQKVVVKKLRGDLSSDLYSETNTNFQICPPSLLADFLGLISMENSTMATYWHSILRVNAEPLLLQVLKAEHAWPVPRYFGMYGRCLVESHCGVALNAFKNADWHVRAELTLQLLNAAKRFTGRHPNFRFYLTDVSPDNIAVSDNLQVTFVDLENVIVTGKHNI